ncbi:sodium:calcium antiporter [candidate division WWE3 bacterium]|nr:sodium:calcium antiporter [candidate division WWE3 bacterium]
MFLTLALFLFGLTVLLISTKALVDKSQQLAHKIHLSPLIIGITIVAIGTSLPELVVSTIASIKGDYGLALGNIIGSNITNILLVLAVGIMFGKLGIGTTKTPKTTYLLITVTALYTLLHFIPMNSFIAGIILITFGILVTIIEYRWGIDGQNHEDFSLISKFQNQKTNFSTKDLILLLVAVIGITLGGFVIVNSVESLSAILGYSTTVLGLCLTAVATSLPELSTTLFSQNNKDEKLTMGNILGSNIYNITFIGGISYLFTNYTYLESFDWIWFISSAIVLFFIVHFLKGKYIPKFIGVLLIGIYFVYLLTVIAK